MTDFNLHNLSTAGFVLAWRWCFQVCRLYKNTYMYEYIRNCHIQAGREQCERDIRKEFVHVFICTHALNRDLPFIATPTSYHVRTTISHDSYRMHTTIHMTNGPGWVSGMIIKTGRILDGVCVHGMSVSITWFVNRTMKDKPVTNTTQVYYHYTGYASAISLNLSLRSSIHPCMWHRVVHAAWTHLGNLLPGEHGNLAFLWCMLCVCIL